MAFRWGGLLSGAGRGIQSAGQAVGQGMLDIEERKRKEPYEQLLLEEALAKKTEREELAEKKAMAQGIFDEYSAAKGDQSAMRGLKETGLTVPEDVPTEPAGPSTGLPYRMTEDLANMRERGSLSPYQLGMRAGLPTASAYLPEAKAEMEALEAENRMNKQEEGILGRSAQADRYRIAKEAPMLIESANKTIESYRGKYSDEFLNTLLELAKVDPIDALRQLTGTGKPTESKEQTLIRTMPLEVEKTAGTAAAGTAAREQTSRQIQRESPVLSDAQSGGLTDSFMGVKYLNRLKQALSKGDVGYFDIDKRTGQFVNPEAADAYGQLVEIVGRKRSGAAISESEWSNFSKQVLNKNFLLTEAGRKQALQQVDDYLDRFYASGANVTGDENWYNRYTERAKKSRQNAEDTENNDPLGIR